MKDKLTKINKHKLSILTIAVILVFVAITSGYIQSQASATPKNPIDGININRSEVLVLGKDYNIDKEQGKSHKEHQKEFEKIKEKEEKENKKSDRQKNSEKTNQDSTISDDDGKGEGAGNSDDNEDNSQADQDPEDPSPGNEEESDLPTISTNLKNKETYSGTYKVIEVTAKDYKGNYITSVNLHTEANGEKLTSTNAGSTTVVKYRLDFIDGDNTVSITATDKYGKSSTVKYTIYNDSTSEQEKFGSATFSVEASVLGLSDIIPPTKIDLYKGEQLSYIIDRMLTEKGLTYNHTGALKNGFYLSRIYKPGVTNGWKIPDELLEKLEDAGFGETSYEENSLGEKDFRRFAGWMYQVDGVFIQSGISTYTPNDGDVIRIRFTLHNGRDLGGNLDGESWGNW